MVKKDMPLPVGFPTVDSPYSVIPVPDDFLNWQHGAAIRTYNRELERQATLDQIRKLGCIVNWAKLDKPQNMMPEVAKDFWWQREALPKLGGILPNARTLPEPWASRFMKFYFVMLALTPAYLLLLCVL